MVSANVLLIMQQNKKNTAEYRNFLDGFSKRLRKCRNDKQLSMSEIAQKLGLASSSQISRYESGENFPDVYTLSKLHEVLGIDLHWLITGEQYSPQKRLETYLKDVSKQYNDLVLELEAARNIVDELDLKEGRGETLTHDEQGLLLENKGRIRSLPRMMENYIKYQADILKK